MNKTYFNWSTGKDAALALYKILQDKNYTVQKLVTTTNKDFDRVSMHGLRISLLEAQIKSIGISLHKISFPAKVDMNLYNATMQLEMNTLLKEGFTHSGFGDIFLEDLKNYRDKKLAEVGIQGVYPLWKKDTKTLLKELLDLGFKAITVCVNAKLLGKDFVGRIIDNQFIKDLPGDVDVCGENGEFHTFVFDGPIFKYPIDFSIGEKVLKSYTLSKDENSETHQSTKHNTKNYDTSFWYCDLLLK
jgi:uncharacterized protein (TIGR00290 family)